MFRKTMENLRKRKKVDLVTTAFQKDKLRRLIGDPGYISHRIFNENLAAIHSQENKVNLNKPVYVGQALLDLSKLLMYDFWYSNVKAK